MASFTASATIPDEKVIDMRDTFALAFGYPVTVDDGNGNQIPNPQSKLVFVQLKVNEQFREWIKNTYKAEKDKQTAAAAALNNSINVQ